MSRLLWELLSIATALRLFQTYPRCEQQDCARVPQQEQFPQNAGTNETGDFLMAIVSRSKRALRQLRHKQDGGTVIEGVHEEPLLRFQAPSRNTIPALRACPWYAQDRQGTVLPSA